MAVDISAVTLLLVLLNSCHCFSEVSSGIPRPLSIISGAAMGEPAAVSAKLEIRDQPNSFISGFEVEWWGIVR